MAQRRGPKLGILRLRRCAALLSCCAICTCFVAARAADAQTPAIDELKGKIFDAHMAQQTFPGLKYCNELTGKSFYFQLRNRVLNLEEYFRSLENMVKAGVNNPAKRSPWTLDDAKERWEEVKKQAAEDKRKCELVQSLPEMEKQLQELEKNTTTAEKKE
jgi:tRNA nucleotidyltransferase/poly(A) polymerase